MLHWHNFFQRCAHIQKTFKYITTDTFLLCAIIEGTLVIVYQINTPLWYKTTCCESESRTFDCQWILVSFLVKQNQFYREERLTCPLYRPTEDICIGIYVLKRVFNVWYMLKLEPQGALIAHLSTKSTSGYKLDSRVKKCDYRMEPKTTTLHNTCSRLLLWIWFVAVAFRSKKVFWKRGPPLVTYLASP